MAPRNKRYLLTYTYEVVVEASSEQDAEFAAADLIEDLEARFHSPKHRSSPVTEAGFTYNDDVAILR
jgi:hypothetical protein